MTTEVFADWVKETTTTTGTGTITLGGAASSDVMAISDSGVADGSVVPYSIIDGNNREVGLGTYTATGTLLARTTVLATWASGVFDNTTPTAISLSGTAQVYIALNSFQAMSKTDTTFTNYLRKSTSTLNGTATNGHVNLGSGTSVTGTAASSQDFCTIGGGENNSATQGHTTVSGGKGSQATGAYATVGGGLTHTASGAYTTIAGGQVCIANATAATVVGGYYGDAKANYALAGGGQWTNAGGLNANALGGRACEANANYSAVLGGRGNFANHTHAVALCGASATRANYDVVIGATDTDTLGVVANNTIRLQGNGGNILIDGTVSSPEADYAEFWEWYDGNPNNEDRVGRFVSLHEGKIVMGAGRADKTGVENYLASVFTDPNSPTSVPMLGIVSANPALIGDAAPNHWVGRHTRDKFKRLTKLRFERYEWEELSTTDERGEPFEEPRLERKQAYVEVGKNVPLKEYPQYIHQGIMLGKALPEEAVFKEVIEFPAVNPAYDPNIPYIPRQDRPEWAAIGLLGKLIVDSAEPITSNYVRSSQDGRALNGTAADGWRVIKVIDNYTVQVLFHIKD